MSRSSASSSGGLIQRYRLGLDPISEVRAQESRGVQVHLPTEKGLQLFLDRDEAQADALPGHEVDQYVDITLRPKLAPEHRAEESEARNPVPAAKLRKPLAVYAFEYSAHGPLMVAQGLKLRADSSAARHQHINLSRPDVGSRIRQKAQKAKEKPTSGPLIAISVSTSASLSSSSISNARCRYPKLSANWSRAPKW